MALDDIADASAHSLLSPRPISDDAPWRWLAAGWSDLCKDPVLSLGYGALFVGGGYLICWLLWNAGLSSMIPAIAGAFALVGPLLAVGLYELSRRREMGEPVTVTGVIFVKASSPMQLAYMGFVLMFAFLVWARIAILLYALFVSGTYIPLTEFWTFAIGTPQGLAMIVIGSLIGAAIAFFIFTVTAFSIPMLMHRKVDFFTAVAASIRTLLNNKKPVILWAWIIAIGVAVSIATFFIGLIVVFPLLGHATWHAYRDAFEG